MATKRVTGKSTPPSKRSGAKAKGGTTPCPSCCCCPTSATMTNVQMFTTPPIFRGGANVANGHSFDFVIKMNFCAGKKGTSDCVFEWWEKVDVPAIPGHPPNTWTDMFKLVPTSPTFAPWNARVVPCPGGGALTVTIVDIPSLGMPPGVTQSRTLQFRLIIRAGGGCRCAHHSMMARGKQVLTMVNGALVPAHCSFKVF